METGMLTLTDFLLARIAEDEEDAYDWRTTRRSHYDRVIDDCEAKRRIVARATAAEEALHQPGLDDSAYFIRLSCRDSWRLALADLALPYADHPDYRQEWRP